MRTLSETVILIGLCLGVFALIGLYSQREFGEFLGLSIIFLQINLLMGIFMLVSGLAIMLYAMAQDRVIERAAQREIDTAEGKPPREDIPLCYSCLTPAKPHQHFCMNCWTPLTSHAEIDPLGQIYATGDMYWKLTRGPQERIALIGLFLLIGPLLIGLPFVVIPLISEFISDTWRLRLSGLLSPDSIIAMLAGLLCVAAEIVYVVVFIKAIRNYCQQSLQAPSCSEVPQETEAEPDSDDSDD